ncbi:MAG TPA: hypothetical protein VNE39_15760, partial [Planctomycetota bacterium]|nr:hypothetical protein [Planctomycetota bacterium]
AAWVGTDWRQPLSPIVHTEPVDVVPPALAAKRRAARAEQKAAAEAFLKPLGPLPADKYAIALLKDEKLPNHDPKLADEFAELLRKNGHEVTLVNADQLCNPFAITTDRFDMLFLPACHTLPGEAGPVIKAYCDKGGDLVALGTPAFRTTLAKVGGKWLSQADWRKLLDAQPTAHMLFDFDAEDLSKWHRHTNAPASPITRELVPGRQGKALRVLIPNMTGWDGFASPKLYGKTFPDGHTLTCLWAKGVGEIDRLMLEWRERDGSRWIATFRVGAEWQRIVLAPSDFKFWQSVKTRGGPGDGFKPENAEQLVIGVAHTHTGPRSGRYEFLIDQLGTAPAPPGLASPQFLSPPILENFSPTYKFYQVSRARELWRQVTPLPIYEHPFYRQVPDIMYAHHPRPGVRGILKGRAGRWVPVLEAIDEPWAWRGAPVSLYVDFPTASVRLAIGVPANDWYRGAWSRDVLSDAVELVAKGLFLLEAGTPHFTYRMGEEVRLGASVANLSRLFTSGLAVRFEIAHSDDDPRAPWESEGGSFCLRPGEKRHLSADIPISLKRTDQQDKSVSAGMGPSRDELYSRRLADGFPPPTARDTYGRDGLSHRVGVFIPTFSKQRLFVTAREGDFWLDGKKWYPQGVNYMPSTGIGVEDNEYFEYWLDAKPYDPEFVQRDLERIKAIGFNSVSIFIYHRSLGANNLLDFLRRCDELGLKVNLSLRPGTPMDYKWDEWKEIIEKNRLWEQDVIWAYDIAWEPFFGTEAERKRYDPLWREWVVKKHGSLDAARKAWGAFPVGGGSVPREEEKKTRGTEAPPTEIAGPNGWQLTHDGEHRTFVSDYRRFADELVHERYLDAYKKIKSIDPNHLISFRMTVTGDPTFNSAHSMPYDFKGVAKAMDFLAPEGYGRIGDWERVKAGLFTVATARMCAPDKPVFWAEAGVSAWDNEAMAATPEKLDFQARFYRDFYRMMLASHSNGVAWWWYPGGYRVNERSDYGIINPDGTDRPVTKVIREFGPKLTAERAIPKPDVWIDIDRDADARGLFGVYEKVKGEFWRAVEVGKVVGLRRVTRDP